ncbi:HAMP domain-containing sensor histidine kinase [Pseudomonas sp. KFB-139]|uniref:histidine kinase n=1 Tax=Pseudomonas serbiensis TaxID=3064350 RepID=A0ABT9CKF9_9PSED|nr:MULTISPECIES: HAMP domain-containing sensor histidine kinase [Pseudomonas]MDO7925232.1 HAMP domain-containing sensor histidine kinase [Pseudomonas sp. KFB-138]
MQWLVNVSFAMFGVMLTLALVVQGRLSQGLVEHPVWQQVLESSTQNVLHSSRADFSDTLPTEGAVRGWLLTRDGTLPADMPAFLATLAPGYYREGELDSIADSSPLSGVLSIVTPRWGPFADAPGDTTRARAYTALVTSVPQGRLIMAIDMTGLEDEQNASVQLSLVFLLFNFILICLVIRWFHLSLTRPIADLAWRMRKLDPLKPSQRLPATYRKSELNTIAQEANAHLERVELAVERERSLLDQASHEFRTPLAIISGAADVLHKQQLPERAQRPLRRIDEAVDTLTQIMEALLYLSREPSPQERKQVTVLHGLLPELVNDHTYLLSGKPVRYVLGDIEPLTLQAPESMVRIAAGNLLRNAAEHTHEGEIHVSLVDGVLCIRDSGSGFDATQAAYRFTESLKQSGKRAGGAGLGLFLTQRICERFGWQLTLESSLSVGTSAIIDFMPDRG